jgi:zinc protease
MIRRPLAALIGAAILLPAPQARAAAPRVVTLEADAPSPLVSIAFQIRAGSARDPIGLEGLGRLAARMIVEGGFGDREAPVTKERVAEITRAWGERAYPSVRVGKEAITFTMTVPGEAVAEYAERILAPMFSRPLFDADELERLRGEAREELRSLRLERIEAFGLEALDALVHAGDGRAHPTLGTMRGLGAVEVRDLRGWFAAYVAPENATLGISGAGPAERAALLEAFSGIGNSRWRWVKGRTLGRAVDDGRSRAVIVALPNAISTGLHAAVPIEVRRGHPDYWALFVANVWFGTHRDSQGRLFSELREKRGYNYGDYSYVEHFANRSSYLIAPPNTPRTSQYFSIWIRPVDHRYAAHLARAASWEFERFSKGVFSERDCAAAKKKARVLYLSYAETRGRILAAELDDAFYGLEDGWLRSYLESVDALTCDDLNEAVRRHLGGKRLDYVVVTDDAESERIARELVTSEPVYGKPVSAYQVDEESSGTGRVWRIPDRKLDLVRLDAVWAHHDLGLAPGRVRVVSAERVFESSDVLP